MVVVVVGCVCVGGRDEAISKLKGAGATHALPRSYLHEGEKREKGYVGSRTK